MDDVMIKCPETGKAVRTGMVADKDGFEDSVLDESTLQCPHCAKTRTWNKSDARFAED